jgi:hypothetical protein
MHTASAVSEELAALWGVADECGSNASVVGVAAASQQICQRPCDHVCTLCLSAAKTA